MFKRSLRLSSSNRLTNASIIHTTFFILKLAKNTLEHNTYGFIVSKRIDKRAVVRNRLKRRFRAIVEELHPALQTGYDMLFVMKALAREQKPEVFRTSLYEIFQKAGVIKVPN